MQTRQQSRLEVGADFVVSLGINLVGQVLFYGTLATTTRTLAFAALILGLAVPRRYATRRLFNAFVPAGDRQTRWQAWVEVIVDTVFAIVVAILLQRLVYGAAATWGKAGGLTVALYLVTLGRRYAMRRMFDAWEARQANMLQYS